ncbi:MAG: hypothetical protein RL062_444 [Bacteroidota bacterium]
MRAFTEAVKWVFLDLDNTLWDFDANAEEAIKELYHRHQLHLHSDFHVDQFLALYKDVNAAYWLRYEKGEVTKEVLRTARFTDTFTAMGVAPALQPANVWQEYLEICPVMTRMMPGALDCLAELKKKYRIALLTNGFEKTQQTKIAVSGIAPYIDFMLSSEAIGIAKPDPKFFGLALEKAGCDAKEAVYLGDTWHTDVEGGMGAGIVSYWYRRGQDFRSMPQDDPCFGGVVEDLLDFARL